MGTHISKPFEVDAFIWTGDRDQIEDPIWINQAIRDAKVMFLQAPDNETIMLVNTPHNTVKVEPGDYIIREQNGDMYPLKAELFKELFMEKPNE